MKIESIKIKHEVDESPDTSWMGEFTDKLDGWVIDRETGHLLSDEWEEEEPEEFEDEDVEYVVYRYGVTKLKAREMILESQQAHHKWEKLEHSDTGQKIVVTLPYSHWVDHRSVRYFAPSPGGSSKPEEWGDTSEETVKKYGAAIAPYAYALQDWKRMETLNDGHWCFLVIISEAKISTVVNGHTFHDKIYEAVGMVESDSDEYLKEMGNEQLAILSDTLLEMGFTQEQIDEAMEEVERP